MLKKQCFICFSSVSQEISVNLILRCHYSRYTILTNCSTRVLPSTTIRRIPQLFCFNIFQLKIIKTKIRDKTGMVQIAYRNRELTSYPKINHVFASSKAVFTAGAFSSQYQAAINLCKQSYVDTQNTIKVHNIELIPWQLILMSVVAREQITKLK